MPSKLIPARNVDLDFLRGLAILLVLAYHLYNPPTSWPFLGHVLDPVLEVGHRGVDLFFVLSGFLVGGLLLREYRNSGTVEARRFLLRRILKIWPAYYVFILVQVLLRRHPYNTFLLQNAFHFQNYVPTSLSQTWSLAIEEHFYLGLALFLAWATKKRWAPRTVMITFIAVCVVSGVLRTIAVLQGNYYAAHGETQNRIDNLLFGVILAMMLYIYPASFEKLTRRAWPLIVASVITVIIIFWWAKYRALESSLGYTVTPLGLAAFMCLLYRHGHRINRNWIYRGVAWVGLYSYGTYLWYSATREPMRHLVERVNTNNPVIWVLAVAVQFAASIILGYGMSRLVEIPFLKIRETYFPALLPSGHARPSAAQVEIANPAFPLNPPLPSPANGQRGFPEFIETAFSRLKRRPGNSDEDLTWSTRSPRREGTQHKECSELPTQN